MIAVRFLTIHDIKQLLKETSIMHINRSEICQEAEQYVTEFFGKNISPEYVFHDLQHTRSVVEATAEMAAAMSLDKNEREWLELAAWFHDLGYNEGYENHEERSAGFAEAFLTERNYAPEGINKVRSLIISTQPSQQSQTTLQGVLKDADMSHLGKKTYWDRCGRVRQELFLTRDIVMDEGEWLDFEVKFLENHEYSTSIGKALYERRKAKHLRKLLKERDRLSPAVLDSFEELDEKVNKKEWIKKAAKAAEKKAIKDLDLGRGVETMYRNTYRTHINLSAIADNKANIMLSINAIIVSIVLSTLVPQFSTDQRLVLPTCFLLVVCLVAIVFATLSTRPKVTQGTFTREDIEKKRSNLLFFGNFYKMPLEDFQWGVTEMIRDRDFLYGSMTRDLYYLGIVLAKKYRYLSICYAIFMYGLIGAVVLFGISFLR